MMIVHVQIHVKPESVDAFREATIANARQSILEPGIAQFDLLQREDDPSSFTLIEVYRTPDAQLRHRETAHYNTWRDTVAEMMAAPRASAKYIQVFPEVEGR
jgi:quinol monooxygenase YgiN